MLIIHQLPYKLITHLNSNNPLLSIINMKLLDHFLFCFLVSACLVPALSQDSMTSTLDPVSINYVSTISDSTTSNLQGSIMGGTALYIYGIGFDSTFQNNIIWVGNIVCSTTAKGVTQTRIVCYTGAYTSGPMSNLPISIQVLGKSLYTCSSAGCLFSYVNSQTPNLAAIFPRASSANQWINFYGSHKISNLGDGRQMGDIIGFYIGNSLCNRFDISQQNIDPLSNNYIACSLPSSQPGGYYKVKQWVTPGIAKNTYRMLSASVLSPGTVYQFIVSPAINGLSTHSSGSKGTKLTITGTGFSTTPSDISVTVAGIPCEVKSSTVSQIVCEVGPNFDGNSFGLLNTNSTQAQVEGFISGTGFLYARYNTEQLSNKVISNFRNLIGTSSTQIRKLDSDNQMMPSIIGELATPSAFIDFNSYGEVLKGYFVAPRTGNYIFRGLADDALQVYMSSVKGSKDKLNYSNPLLKSQAWWQSNSNLNYYVSNYSPLTSSPVYMEAGDAYYMQVYHLSFEMSGFFKVSVELPNTDETIPDTVYEVQRIDIVPVVTPQIVQFVVKGANQGTINYRIRIQDKNLNVIYNNNKTLNYNASASEFTNMLTSFSNFYNVGITVVRTDFDFDNNPTLTSGLPAYTYKYTVTIPYIRSSQYTNSSTDYKFKYDLSNCSNTVNTSTVPSVTDTIIQNHSPPVAGTYTITINDVMLSYETSPGVISTAVSYQNTAAALANLLRNAYGPSIEVDLINSRYIDGASWIISFVGLKGDIPQIVTDSSLLTGGNAGTNPEAKITTIRNGSLNQLVQPVSTQFLATSASAPEVIVSINKAVSRCLGDCSFTIDNSLTPVLNSATLSNHVLSLDISSSSGVPPYEVSFGNQPCTYVSGTNSDYTCELSTNPDGSPIIEAGSYRPTVLIPSEGFADNSLVAPIDWNLQIVSLDLTQGFESGGLSIKMSGIGFPTSATKTFTLKQCGVSVQIIEISNTQIRFISAPCIAGASIIQISFNGQTDSIAFNYISLDSSYPQISSIDPKTYSPVLKGFMTINGSNFGNDKSQLNVWLNNGTNIYKLNVIEASDITLKVRIPGGVSGNFNVLVQKMGVGYAQPNPINANAFSYGIFIDSITPLSGSINGGTILTINGQNFSPNLLQNQAYIGNALGWNCKMLTSTTSTITCQTPPINANYSLDQPVIVVGRAIQDSICRGSCTFTYDNTSYPTVSNQNPPIKYTSGESIVFQGTQLINNGVKPLVYVGNTLTIVDNDATNNTIVTFQFPALVNGTYDINVYVDGIGYAYPTFKVDNILEVTSSTANGSWVGGTIYLIGNGLVDTNNKDLFVTVNSTSTSLNPFNYTIRNDNTPQQFGIDFLGCAGGKIVSIYYKFKNQLITRNYSCVAGSITVNLTLNGAVSRPYNNSSQPLIFTKKTNLNARPTKVYAYPLNAVSGDRFGSNIQLPFTSTPDVNFTVDARSLGSGKYAFEIHFQSGLAYVPNKVDITDSTEPILSANVDSSYFGGSRISITIANPSIISQFSRLTVGGVQAILIPSESTLNNIVYRAPPLITALSQSTYHLAEAKVLKGVFYADTVSKSTLAFDGLVSTRYSSSNSLCYIGWNFGQSQKALITSIRYFPNPLWKSAISYLAGAKITASNDGSTWTTLVAIDSSVHTGWNIWRPDAPLVESYQYIRFEHNSTSQCSLAEFQITGYLYAGSITTVNSNTRDAVLSDGTKNFTFVGAVTYKDSATPKVTNIQPKYSSPAGGNNLTISGTGFGQTISDVSVVIDGIDCVVQSVTDNSVICTTGKRPSLPSKHSFVVRVAENKAFINCDKFLYADRWSDEQTWGGDMPPVEGDTVYVPKGMVLLVDTSTPPLYSIIVEGSIVFSDEVDMVIQTHFLIVSHGVFQAGTESNPYEKKLTFILSGDIYDKQLPGFGNKVIGCHSCVFDMHGKKRDRTWTELSQTAEVGTKTIYLMQPVDWQVNQVIVIASSSFDHTQAEERTIKAVSADKTILTIDKPLKYRHLSVIEIQGNDSITMRAQVALLSRNIKVTGDLSSNKKLYGAHVMMHGPASQGLVGRIQYSQFTRCGQPQIVGRYCIHFHMNGDVMNSYVRGNAVHHSFARVLTIHAAFYLTVQYNVGYWVHGHNIFLQDGIEQYNLIQYNLMISSISVFNMLQTDISVASYWITNPLNTVRYNHAAGSDFYGLWYQIKPNPDGASATSDICPTGLPLGQCHDNVAHSNTRFGLRIFKLWSALYPCKKIRNDSMQDPWSSNPSIQNVFYNMVLWRNAEDGLLAEQVGNTIFRNFTIADSGRAGVEFYKTNFTKEPVIADNFVVIGQSESNGMPDWNFTTPSGPTSGLITSRTDGSAYNNIRFYRFPPLSTVISVGSKNEQIKLRATQGKSYYFSNISYTDITGNYLFYIFTRRYTIYDLDGTLSGTNFDGVSRTGPVAITPYYGHNEIPGICSNASDQKSWNSSLICNTNINVNNLMFSAGQPSSMFQGIQVSAYRLSNNYQNVSDINSGIGRTWVYKTSAQQKNTWSFPFVSGYTYNVWWSTGIDWTSIAMTPSYYHNTSQDAFVIRFNYTTNRQLFDIAHIISGNQQTPLLTPQTQQLNYSTCKFGDYYHDSDKRYLFVCVSGKGKSTYDLLNLNGVTCRYLCPKEAGQFTKQAFIRQWSNLTQWPGGVLPKPGDNITVNGNWTILMDVDVTGLNNLTVDGDVILTDANRQLSANFIWIRYGSLSAGNSSNPFQYNFTITLNGQKTAKTFTIDEQLSVNKYIVVTGALNLYGKVPATVSTRLTAGAFPGDTSISVLSTNGWTIGNRIGIAPSFAKYYEYEEVTITGLTSTSVTFTPALNFTHYGDNYIWNSSYGNMDMRAAVGVIDRNIKIVRGPDAKGWGFGVVVYAWKNASSVKVGQAVIRGVQFSNGGQYDTISSAFGVINTGAGQKNTQVSGCSFEYCNDYCMYFSNANNVTINNNFFFVGRKFIVYAQDVYKYNFTNNVMIGAINRTSMIESVLGDDVACYSQYTAPSWDANACRVQNNLCQGSNKTGFEFPQTPCSQLGKGMGFINNVAGSSHIGFLLSGPMQCAGGEGLRAYGNRVGIITNPAALSFVWNDLILADNGRSIGLRFGGFDNNNNNSMIWKNSYITAVSRPNCSYCYGDNATLCTNTRAVRLLANSRNTELLPKIFGQTFEVICKAELFDSQAWIYNVTFNNFKTNYQGVLAGKCSENKLFQPHPIDDSNIGNHHFYNTTCTNCDSNALGRFDPPIQKHFGWSGGCGNIPCTGRNNYLIHDHDGTLFGFKGVIIPNNSDIGNNTSGCTFNPATNGHVCERTDFARLKYTSIAPDFQSRIMWPVTLKYEGSNWTSTTNGWRQWEWDGDEPLNKRMGRFLSIVQLYKIYNMSFAAQPPIDMVFSFSLTSLEGDSSKWIGIKIYYPVPNAIQVSHAENNSLTKSIVATDSDNITNYVSTCGANKYFYKNNTIHFIVTADSKCNVRVTLTSSVQVTARLSVDVNKFYQNNGVTTFLDLMTSFLGVTADRIKIVGVYSGSTVVVFVVTPPLVSTSQSGSNNPNSAAISDHLKNVAGKMNSATASDFPGFPSFLGATSTVNLINSNGEVISDSDPSSPSSSEQSNKMIIIGLVIGISGAIVIGLSIYLILRKLRARRPIEPDVSNLEQEASKNVIRSENKSEMQLGNMDSSSFHGHANRQIHAE